MNTIKHIYQFLRGLFFDPINAFKKIKYFPLYIKNIYKYNRAESNKHFSLSPLSLLYHTFDSGQEAGFIKGHYFHMDLWAAFHVKDFSPDIHVDIASRIDGFVGHILPFTKVDYVDIRPLDIQIRNLNFVDGTLQNLPYEDNSVQSLSCLHVLEHVGLGRYGDPIDPNGYLLAAKEISRVLSHEGQLIFATPIGKQRLVFDAHRVFDAHHILEIFSDLKLKSFDFIPDSADHIKYAAEMDASKDSDYGCGLYIFTK